MKDPTPLGKIIRLLRRVELNLPQKEFGEAIGVTASFLSAVEIGKKSLPNDKLELILQKFVLSPETERKLRAFAAIQQSSFSIKVNNQTTWEKRKLAYLFSKKLPNLSDDQVERIVLILNEKGE